MSHRARIGRNVPFILRGIFLKTRKVFNLNYLSKTKVVIIVFIVSIIGSPRAYLSRNRRAITRVSNSSCPI